MVASWFRTLLFLAEDTRGHRNLCRVGRAPLCQRYSQPGCPWPSSADVLPGLPTRFCPYGILFFLSFDEEGPQLCLQPLNQRGRG